MKIRPNPALSPIKPKRSARGVTAASAVPQKIQVHLAAAGPEPLWLRVFVSSRMHEPLRPERNTAIDAIDNTAVARAWSWERDGIPNARSDVETCVLHARQSDALLLILADDITPVIEQEFHAALNAHGRCWVFAKLGASPDANCQKFLRKLARRGITHRNFSNAVELRTHIVTAIRELAVRSVRNSSHQLLSTSPRSLTTRRRR